MWIPLVLCHEQIERKKRMNRRGMDHQSKRFQAPLTFFLWVRGYNDFWRFLRGPLPHCVLSSSVGRRRRSWWLRALRLLLSFSVCTGATNFQWMNTTLFLHFHDTNSCTRSTCSYKQHFLLTSSILFTFSVFRRFVVL